MNGRIILGIGVLLIIQAVVLLAASIIYRKTAGKRIQKELKEEYSIE